jgi:RNA polymerase sigma-70 factor (ECF subfamily)
MKESKTKRIPSRRNRRELHPDPIETDPMGGKMIPSADLSNTGSDEHWVRLTLQGNRGCFEAIVTRYFAALLRFIYSRVRSMQDAEDLCQETFLRAFRALHTFDDRSSFKTWLFSIAFHETVSFLRKKKVPTCSVLPEPAAGRTENRLDSDSREEIWLAARRLPEDQYTLLWLKYRENLSIPQIAQITRKSQMNTRVLLHRARRKLARILDPGSQEDNRRILCGHPAPVPSMQGESNVL